MATQSFNLIGTDERDRRSERRRECIPNESAIVGTKVEVSAFVERRDFARSHFTTVDKQLAMIGVLLIQGKVTV